LLPPSFDTWTYTQVDEETNAFGIVPQFNATAAEFHTNDDEATLMALEATAPVAELYLHHTWVDEIRFVTDAETEVTALVEMADGKRAVTMGSFKRK